MTGNGNHVISAAQRARWAVRAIFLINGLVIGSYFVRMPSLKIANQLTTRQLGIALTIAALAALVGMQFAGRLTARWGSARLAWIIAAAQSLGLVVVGAVRGPVELIAALVIFGMIGGLLDVVMNAQAVAVERAFGQPVLSSCHAAWSMGGISGSLLGGLAVRLGWSLTGHFLALAPVVLLLALLAGYAMSGQSAGQHAPGSSFGAVPAGPGWRVGWTRAVLVFGAMGAMVMLCEGSVATWSGVFLHQNRGASLALASLAYIGFTVCEAAGRVIGDRLRQHFGAAALVRCCCAIAVGGLALALNPSPLLGIVGFSILGAGLSIVLPTIFSAVGNDGAVGQGRGAAIALSRFTTMTYSGILVGPVLIGWAAGFFGIAWALGGLIALLLWVLLNARRTAVADEPFSETAEHALSGTDGHG